MPSFFVPLGALNATTTAVASVGNNLANLNTTGYKATAVSFSDLISKQLGAPGGAPSQLGMGVGIPLVTHQFTQGSIAQSAGAFDAAIQGNGFFVVRNPQGNAAYTRAGNFTLDANGTLVTSTGSAVQGWMAVNGVVSPSGGIGNITIPPNSLQAPLPTTKFTISANLDASAAKDHTFSAPIQVIDSLGSSHTLTVTYTKTGPNAWSYDVSIPGGDLKSGTAGTPKSLATGTLAFDSAGKLTTPAAPPPDTNGVVSVKLAGIANGAADQTISWSFYNSDLSPTLTQYAQASATSGTSQDGVSSAQPVKIQLGPGGVIVAQYWNGSSLNLAQLALANILNPDSMVATGNNEFVVGSTSATPTIGAANTGGRGAIISNALEGSTVDIATEFTNLMQFQRSYQASSKVITTMDEMAQDVINIKR